MADLGGANTKGYRAKRAVGRGVAIAADNRHAGAGCAKLWPHHMDDAAMLALPAMGFNAVAAGIV